MVLLDCAIKQFSRLPVPNLPSKCKNTQSLSMILKPVVRSPASSCCTLQYHEQSEILEEEKQYGSK